MKRKKVRNILKRYKHIFYPKFSLLLVRKFDKEMSLYKNFKFIKLI